MRNVSWFLAHTLAAEYSTWRGGNGHCDKCSCAAGPNEVHILFQCQGSLALSQKKYSFLFFPFRQAFPVEAPYDLHALPRQTVFDFLSQQQNKLCHFILDIMNYFWLGETSN